MRSRVPAALIGVVFGVMLVWSGMTSPNVIREALLFEDSYLYLFMFSAMGTAIAGQLLLKHRHVLRERPARRHVQGAAIFGVGWGLANVCPGPIATQLGQGIGWALFTLGGVAAGIYVYQRRVGIEYEAPV